jgi:hypothetical protein
MSVAGNEQSDDEGTPGAWEFVVRVDSRRLEQEAMRIREFISQGP